MLADSRSREEGYVRMSDKLKPCPFCGSAPEILTLPAHQYGSGLESWWICCPKARANVLECVGSLYVSVLIGGVFGFDKKQAKAKAIELWNTRKDEKK
jgi:hypothetical protein